MSTTNTETKCQPCEICGDDNSVHDWCHGCPAVYCEDCLQKINGYCRKCGYDIWQHKRRKVSKETSGNVMPTVPDEVAQMIAEGCPHTQVVGEMLKHCESTLTNTTPPTRETFESGAVMDTTDYRYDLMSMPVTLELLKHIDESFAAQELTRFLLRYNNDNPNMLRLTIEALAETLNVKLPDLAHFYAQALHEGAGKYGERNWEKGIPESNLLNHALHHLFKLVSGDQSENHRSHLVWNVLTLIHFRLQGQQEGREQ